MTDKNQIKALNLEPISLLNEQGYYEHPLENDELKIYSINCSNISVCLFLKGSFY